MMPPTFKARVASARMLASNVRELVLDRGEPFAFEAGQWVSLAVPTSSELLKRSYSIASPPDGTGRFELAVTLVEGGPASTYLHAAAIGAEMDVTGPQGFFTREPGPALFVGTGTGVAPLRAMMLDALGKNEKRALWLVFGIRTEADILYRAELDALAAKHENVRVFYTLSRPAERWKGLTGYVQTHVEKVWREMESRGEGPPHAYICGLHRMVGSVRDLLRKQMAVPRAQVHSERYD
jgi:NAD(P)H-flavin reductase